jgi:hypothetical protein
MYIGNVFIDRLLIEFNEMVTAAEKRRHLEGLAKELMEENRKEVVRASFSGHEPEFFMQAYSVMNDTDFRLQSWRTIILQAGSQEAQENIRELCMRLNTPV